MNSKFYVYGYFRPDKNEYFYIGKGCGGRAYIHFRHSHSVAVSRTIAKLQRNGFEPEVRILFESTHEECKRVEIELIAFYGRKDLGKGCLLNMTDGGDGTLGRKVAESERLASSNRSKTWWENPVNHAKVRASIKKSWERPLTRAQRMAGAKKSGETNRLRIVNNPEERERLSQQIKRAWLDPDFRQRISEAAKRRMNDPQFRQIISQKIKDKWAADPTYRQRVSNSMKLKFAEPQFLQKYREICVRPERRRKLSLIASLRKHTDQTKAKLSAIQRKLDENQVASARDMFLQGINVNAIAKKFGVSYTVISRAIYGQRHAYAQGALKKEDLKNVISQIKARAARKRRRFSDDDLISMKKMRNRGLSFRRIGKKFGASKSTIMSIFKGETYQDSFQKLEF